MMEEYLSEETLERAKRGLEGMFEQNGYVVVGRGYACEGLPRKADFVIEKDEKVALVSLSMAHATEGTFPEQEVPLAAMSALVDRWCEENGHDRASARVDGVSMLVNPSGKAFVRWNKNRLA